MTDEDHPRDTPAPRERWFQAVFEHSPDGILLYDDEGTIIEANPRACEHLGYDRDVLVGRQIWSFTSGDPETVRERWETMAVGDTATFEADHERADGSTFPVRVRVTRVDLAGGVDFVGILRDISVQQARETELRAARERMEFALESTDAIVYEIDVETGHETRHGPFERIFGLPPETVDTPETFFERAVHPEDRAAVASEQRAVLDGEVDWTTVTYRTHPEHGDARWIRSEMTRRDDAGDDPSVIGLSTDITRRRKREEELERYRTLVETVGDPMYVLDHDGTIAMANDAMLRRLGADEDAVVGADPRAFLAEGDVERGTEALRELQEDPDRQAVTLEVTVEPAEGELFPAEANLALPGEADSHLGSVGVIRDLSERKAREDELQRERDRFRAVFEQSFDAMVLADDEGRYLEVNEAATELFGLPEEALLGCSVAEFAPEEFDFEAAWDTFQATEDETGEFPLVRPDGTERVVEYAATTNVVPGQHLSALRDITDRVAREAELRRQNERLEEFASVVSHDLRNPLGVASGRLELAREAPEEEEHLEAIDAALGRMERIIDDVLWLAHEGRDIGETEPVGLAGAVREAWGMAGGGADRAELVLDGDDLGRVEADPDRLGQLLENLLRNAVAHGGEDVTVTVGRFDGGFYVEDDGPGIPAEHRDQVFEAGYSTDPDGTGFGLRIVRQVAEAHGWAVRATEGADGGARIEVTGVGTVGD